MLRATKRRLRLNNVSKERLDLQLSNGRSWPYETDSFNIVLAESVLAISADHEDFLAQLQEIQRVLKPGEKYS